MNCPRCNKLFWERSVISRRDNKTEICSSCGIEEMIFDLGCKYVTTCKSQAEIKLLALSREAEKAWLKTIAEEKNVKVQLLKELIERIESDKSNVIHIIALMSPEEWDTLKEAIQSYY